ncbi:pimeloyl-ACP methyl ester carboxylesterase [Rhodoblastus acidophilus]|uniref:esterase/lipase family protein n=1 Tax=Rhodoblastus acidophilus TaxID=1074 RepID=UPI0022254C3A|nr:GPI inositol-deacylase [Rhodoblastus acidophilus]MCW2284071.1 pimeloyl-ACP methyl ester carboxylesterase [Rhodoblastus acidophilus]MCW2332767.1 pimeloyl-ACP methyl ester carboxylesterase [Rhodoblastus acidophilus]
MGKPKILSVSDLLGFARLAAEGAEGVTGMVARMHHAVLDTPGLAQLAPAVSRKIPKMVYQTLGAAFRLTAQGAGVASALIDDNEVLPLSWGRETAVAALNGVVGDHLATTNNPLALPMRFRANGHTLALEREALAQALPSVTGKVVVLVHGLAMSDLHWTRANHDHGAALARDFGYTPVYLSYNTGLHISTNGRAFAEALERLVAAWPVEIEDLLLLGYSMGGLVTRSACLASEASAHAWRKKLSKLVFLGTPHHGAPLERIGNWVGNVLADAPYAAALAPLAKIRSAGVTDLRYGAIADEDWSGRDRFAHAPDARRPAPLPEKVACYAIAATLSASPGTPKDLLIGDGLVPVASALGRHRTQALKFAPDRQWIACATGHLDLLSSPAVYKRIAAWLEQDSLISP